MKKRKIEKKKKLLPHKREIVLYMHSTPIQLRKGDWKIRYERHISGNKELTD